MRRKCHTSSKCRLDAPLLLNMAWSLPTLELCGVQKQCRCGPRRLLRGKEARLCRVIGHQVQCLLLALLRCLRLPRLGRIACWLQALLSRRVR